MRVVRFRVESSLAFFYGRREKKAELFSKKSLLSTPFPFEEKIGIGESDQESYYDP